MTSHRDRNQQRITKGTTKRNRKRPNAESIEEGRRRPIVLKVQVLAREFVYHGVRLPDPNPDLTVEQVRDMYVAQYPELATAAVEGPSPVNDSMRYTFTRAVGTKG